MLSKVEMDFLGFLEDILPLTLEASSALTAVIQTQNHVGAQS